MEKNIAKSWVCGDCKSPVEIKGYMPRKYFECTYCGQKGNVVRKEDKIDKKIRAV